MTFKIHELNGSDLFAALPVNQKHVVRERHEAGIGFTYNIPAIPNSPVFLDPSHLAAWFAGYFRAQSDEIDAAEALKKALSDEIGAVEERKKALSDEIGAVEALEKTLSLISEEGN